MGGLGRREPAPYGDLDLILVHDELADITAVADEVWYPIWDSGLRLDHSVRTVEQSVRVAQADAIAALGLLDVRRIAGDQVLADRLRHALATTWRSKARRLLPLLREERIRRGKLAGDTAYLVEPDLKEGRGGMRDVLVLQALAAAQLSDQPSPAVEAAYGTLLDVRDALHRTSKRRTDVLVRQEQIPVMRELGLQSKTTSCGRYPARRGRSPSRPQPDGAGSNLNSGADAAQAPGRQVVGSRSGARCWTGWSLTRGR